MTPLSLRLPFLHLDGFMTHRGYQNSRISDNFLADGRVRPDVAKHTAAQIGEGKAENNEVVYLWISIRSSPNQPLGQLMHAAERHAVRHDHR